MNNTKSNINSNNALADHWHYKIGTNIFPLDYDKRTYEDWSKYQHEPIPDELHEEWKRTDRYTNGIILMPGKVWREQNKGLFFVGIDFDKQIGFQEFCNIFGANTSIDELKQKFIIEQHEGDPNSFHVYLYSEISFTDKHPDNTLGIEIKSNGKGLICATPSYHSETNSNWQIKGTNLPIIMKTEEASKLILSIDEICKKYNVSYLKNEKDPFTSSCVYLTPLIRQMIEILEINLDIIIPEGTRHKALLSIANSLLCKYWFNESCTDKGKSKILDDLTNFFLEINNKLCKPTPLPEKELKTIWLNAQEFIIKNNNKTNTKKNRKSKSGISRINIQEATEQLMSKHHFLTIEESKDILFFEAGVYKKGGDIIIEKELELMYGYSINNSNIISIKGHIMRRTYIKLNEFDKNINIVNIRNGLYNIELNLLQPHSHEYPSLNQKNIAYDPNAKPLLFGKFLQQVLHPKDIRTAIDILAYTFWRTNPYELIFILLGIGANGKNVFTGILIALHRIENVSNISLKAILENKFAIAGLENKDVNIDTEMPQGVLKDISILKKLTGKQPISIEKKGIDAYNALLHSKLFFCANTVPSISDNSDGRFRRQVIISFPNQFEEGKNADPKLLEKLTIEEEKSGIFNVLMKALRIILKNDKIYLNEKTIQEKRQKDELVSDPIGSFIKDAVAKDSVYDDDYTVKEEFYNAYRNFCKYHRLPIESQENFGKILKQKFRVEDGRKTINKLRKTVWLGIRLARWSNKDTKQQILITNACDYPYSNTFDNDSPKKHNNEIES
jgi:putative DNA primase/helicase